MFKGAVSFGADECGRQWYKTTYPCGCKNTSEWRENKFGELFNEVDFFQNCGDHGEISADIQPIIVRHVKAAMMSCKLSPLREADWEVFVKCVMSPQFRVLVEEFKPDIDAPFKKQKYGSGPTPK